MPCITLNLKYEKFTDSSRDLIYFSMHWCTSLKLMDKSISASMMCNAAFVSPRRFDISAVFWATGATVTLIDFPNLIPTLLKHYYIWAKNDLDCCPEAICWISSMGSGFWIESDSVWSCWGSPGAVCSVWERSDWPLEIISLFDVYFRFLFPMKSKGFCSFIPTLTMKHLFVSKSSLPSSWAIHAGLLARTPPFIYSPGGNEIITNTDEKNTRPTVVTRAACHIEIWTLSNP